MAGEQTVIVTADPDGRVGPLATDRAYRIVIPRLLVYYLVLAEGNFCTNREILLPDPYLGDPERDGEPRETALGAVQAALEFAGAQPHLLLIAGDTDTAGSESFNLKLSGRRAENVRLFLAGDRGGWAAHCHENAEVADWQTVLRWVALTRGWDCNPGVIDDEFGPKTSEARRNFRAAYNEVYGGSLALDGPHGAGDWAAYHNLYEVALGEQLGCERQDLAGRRARICWNSPATLACGEHWPIEAVDRDRFASATNRRVELLFFPPGTGITSAGNPPGHGIYGSRRFRFQPIAVSRQRPGRKLWVRFPLTLAQARQRTWRLVLTSSDGGYFTERAMSEAVSAAECADVYFDGLDPGANYTLHMQEGEQQAVVFEDVPFAELAGLSGEVGESEGEGAVDPFTDEDDLLEQGEEFLEGELAPELEDLERET